MALGAVTQVGTPMPSPGRRQSPIYPLIVGNNGAFMAVRASSAQGSCGTKGYPCKHPGVDVNGPRGTKVHAPEGGMIVTASSGAEAPWKGYGPWLVVIKGDSGRFHLLSHLDPGTFAFGPVGKRVTAGDVVGTVSSARHTHWELRKKLVPNFSAGESNMTNNLDPVAWLKSSDMGLPILVGGVAVIAYVLLKR